MTSWSSRYAGSMPPGSAAAPGVRSRAVANPPHFISSRSSDPGEHPMSEPTTVVITGAFGALGAAVARRFAARGARVGLLGHGPVPGWASQEFGTPHVIEGGVDLTQQNATNAAMRAVAEATGGF